MVREGHDAVGLIQREVRRTGTSVWSNPQTSFFIRNSVFFQKRDEFLREAPPAVVFILILNVVLCHVRILG